MNFAIRMSTAVVFVGLLVINFTSVATDADQTVQQLKQPVESSSPSALTVADNTVEWTDSSGNNLTHVKPETTAVFYINDDALETTRVGVATFSGHATNSRFFDIPNGTAGPTASATTSAGVTRILVAPKYSTSTPATTPWTGAPVVTSSTTGQINLAAHNPSLGTVHLLADAGAGTTTIDFQHHVADSWDGQNTNTRRAKVVSTSDPQGEWVTINEVAVVGSTATSPTSRIFRGGILLSSDAATQGTNADGVWVQDGDTLTVTYLRSDGLTLDSDAITVDAVKPTVSNISPPDGTITSVQKPVIAFDVTDTGSGIASNPATTITIQIFAGGSTTTIPGTTPAYQPIANGFRVIFAQNTSWLGTFGFGVSDGTPFTWTLTAADKAGNITSVTNKLTIDVTKPTVSSAKTGIGYDTSGEKETTGIQTSVRVTFTEEIDASSVSASDFTVAGIAPSAAVVGTKDSHKKNVYLTVGTLAGDAKPLVMVTGTVTDIAGNAVDTSSSVGTNKVVASDGLKPVIVATTITPGLGVKDDKVKITVTSNEKLAVTGGLVVSIIGPSGSSVNQSLTTTAPSNPLVREGEITIPAGAGVTGMYGVSIQATDLGNNPANNLTKVTDEAVPSSKIAVSLGNTVVTVAKGPIGDNNFDGLVNAADIGSLVFSSTTASSANITAVDASARTITLSGITVGSAETATVTYWYPKTDVFEVDNSPPIVTFDPADDADVALGNPTLKIIFDEEEYPGDNFRTVTVTSATLTAPGGATTNIQPSLTSTTNRVFAYAASNLGLGKHTIAASGKDTAGNDTGQQSSTFTVTDTAQIATPTPTPSPTPSPTPTPGSGGTADLSVFKTGGPNPIVAGTNLTYNITVTNNGPNTSKNVRVTDALPIGASLVSISTNEATCSTTSQVISCNFGDLASGATSTVTIVVKVSENATGTLKNVATTTSDTLDQIIGNNTFKAVTTVIQSLPLPIASIWALLGLGIVFLLTFWSRFRRALSSK